MNDKVGVVLNPTKFSDQRELRAAVSRRAEASGRPVCWFETTVDEPGAGLVANALADGCTLFIACGGDGTIAACAGALVGAGGGVRLAVIPVGTGNLFARNLELPFDLEKALDVAFGSATRPIDVLESAERRFVVMAGLGFDAALIRDTDDTLKARIGWLAYLGGLGKALARTPRTRFVIRVDDDPAVLITGVGVLVGNVGALQGGVRLLTAAEPDDGLLDVMVLAPRRPAHWLALLTRIVLRQAHKSPRSLLIQGRQVTITADAPIPVEYDGEFSGQTDRLEVSTLAAAVNLCCPA